MTSTAALKATTLVLLLVSLGSCEYEMYHFVGRVLSEWDVNSTVEGYSRMCDCKLLCLWDPMCMAVSVYETTYSFYTCAYALANNTLDARDLQVSEGVVTFLKENLLVWTGVEHCRLVDCLDCVFDIPMCPSEEEEEVPLISSSDMAWRIIRQLRRMRVNETYVRLEAQSYTESSMDTTVSSYEEFPGILVNRTGEGLCFRLHVFEIPKPVLVQTFCENVSPLLCCRKTLTYYLY
ncbi:uncharacterized protein LOC143037574 [Oratosquilla oratoria]|uniref:uncharacterized protein LOC143037574 n=1 Tax=Oratosquilla oratoria TaxID=337810 RepID=UPI003F76C851